MPALPLHEAGKYVAGAYIVFVALILIYVSIMAARLSRVERDLGELLELAQRRLGRGGEHDLGGLGDGGDSEPAPEPEQHQTVGAPR